MKPGQSLQTPESVPRLISGDDEDEALGPRNREQNYQAQQHNPIISPILRPTNASGDETHDNGENQYGKTNDICNDY